MKQCLIAFFCSVALAFAIGCGPSEEAGSKPSSMPVVVATTSHLADLAKTLLGDRAEVIGLMGPGVDPHLYKASAGDLDRLSRADIVLVHGLHLEGRMGDVLERLTKPKVIRAEDALSEADLLMSRDLQKKPDPHIWFDPDLWSKVITHTAEQLKKDLPESGAAIIQNQIKLEKEMVTLKSDLKTLAESVPKSQRVLVTAHDAFGYFGRAYGFEVHGIQGISTATEAGASDLRKLADLIASRKIKAIFGETSVNGATIRALQEAVQSRGAKVVVGGTLYSDALGSKGSGAETYAGTLMANMKTIVEALK